MSNILPYSAQQSVSFLNPIIDITCIHFDQNVCMSVVRFQNEAYYLAVTQAIADKLSPLLFNGTDSGVLTYLAPSPQGGDGWMQLCIVMKVGSESNGRDTHSNGHSIPLFFKMFH